MTNPCKYKLSIAIPLYNGEEFLADTLEAILSQGFSDQVEIVLCDDISTDRTMELAGKFGRLHENVKVFQNAENLGMDRNFERVVEHATGEYFWFCGQDDIFEQGAVEKVLAVLHQDSTIDFIYVNYCHWNHDLSKVITEKMLTIDADIVCRDAQSFFAITGLKLPTFLPSFILRKALWDKVDKKPFYGTQYIQIGALLSVLADIKTYFISDSFVKGRVPDTGWQQNKLKLLDIHTGYLEVITYFYNNKPDLVTRRIYQQHFGLCWKNIYNNIYLLRIEKIALNQKIKDRFGRIFDRRHLFYSSFLLIVPRKIFTLFYSCFYRISICNDSVTPQK